MKFSQLDIGDMFNTKPARWVKVGEKEAMIVMSAILKLGRIDSFNDDRDDITVLYSRKVENEI